ncbi:MAG: hypothetical protein QX203_01650 [Methylococcaceae bacterium]
MQSQHPSKLVLMYHSLSSAKHPGVLGSFPVEFSDFKAHLHAFIDLGYQIKPSKYLQQTPESGEKWLFVTSDDGTVDWTRNALPWCESQNIYTHTAVVTGPWQAQPIYPLAHWLQVLLALRTLSELEVLAGQVSGCLTEDEKKYIDRIYAYETQPVRRLLKGACNLILTDAKAREVLGDMSAKEQEALACRFESPDYFQHFNYAELGTHTVSHSALGDNVEHYISHEINASHQHLLDLNLQPSHYFTLPMKPKFGATLHDLTHRLQQKSYHGLLYSAYEEWDGRSFVIPRLDAKSIPAFLEKMKRQA